MYLVTQADSAFGGRIAARLLCSGEVVRALVSKQPGRRLRKLRAGGAEVVYNDGHGDLDKPGVQWRGVTGVVHAAFTETASGKEAIASLSDHGVEAIIRKAAAFGRQLILVSTPPRAQTRVLLRRSGLSYTLFYAQTLESEFKLSSGARGQLLERRRHVYFLPLQGVADVAVAASVGIKHTLLRLPTEARRYHSVVEQVETLLRQPTCSLRDALLTELVMGSPYKLITPGVARALGLTFSPNYLEQVFTQTLSD